MNKEFTYIIGQICRDKGLAKDTVIEALESALLTAAKKKFGGGDNISLVIDPENCELSISAEKEVVEKVQNRYEEISLQEAKRVDPEKQLGDTISLPLELKDFGRIAAQSAKQVILQKVKEAEREIIFNEYKEKIGSVVSGLVERREKGVCYIDLGRTEGILFHREMLPGEHLKRGDAVRAIVQDVRIGPKGPEIIMTRTTPEFVAALFRSEVPEIDDGIVIVKNIVREAGERTKIAVYSTDKSIDPVGACVGMKGTRVQSIVRELHGERIDIIPWSEDPQMLISRTLSPASVERIGINEEDRTAMVVVNDQQLSIAIGKRGQNIRLAMKLTGWEIEIISESEYSRIMDEDAEEMEDADDTAETEEVEASQDPLEE